MKTLILIFSTLCLISLFSACQKDTHTTTSQPTIHVHQPVEGTTYNAGDTVPVNVHFTDEDELHNYHVSVKNTTMNTELLHLHGHQHGTSHEVDTYVVATATMHADYELTAEVSNHNGAVVKDTTHFHVHP